MIQDIWARVPSARKSSVNIHVCKGTFTTPAVTSTSNINVLSTHTNSYTSNINDLSTNTNPHRPLTKMFRFYTMFFCINNLS